MLTGAPEALIKDAKKRNYYIKRNIFYYFNINYTIFNAIIII